MAYPFYLNPYTSKQREDGPSCTTGASFVAALITQPSKAEQQLYVPRIQRGKKKLRTYFLVNYESAGLCRADEVFSL
jgi:hypothetical protein